MKKWTKRITLGILSIILLGSFIPQNLKMPVVGADSNSYRNSINYLDWILDSTKFENARCRGRFKQL